MIIRVVFPLAAPFPRAILFCSLRVPASAVEAKALSRGDGEVATCPICREAFRGEGEVILSCSHVFHKA